MKPKAIFEKGFFFWQGRVPVGLTSNSRVMLLVTLGLIAMLIIGSQS